VPIPSFLLYSPSGVLLRLAYFSAKGGGREVANTTPKPPKKAKPKAKKKK
jgi:hypothetical protein